MTVDAVGRHLHLGKRAPHAVAVDHADAGVGGRDDRLHRVAAADLGRDQGKCLASVEFLQRAQRAHPLVAFLDFFDRDHGRADTANRYYQRVIGDLAEAVERHLLAAAQLPQAAQLADIWIAATARAEDRSADGDGFDVRFGEDAHGL